MGGDYSRVRFQPRKPFAAVLLQQGRVSTDSDWNEAEAIRDHARRMLVTDLLGQCAFVGDGYRLVAEKDRLTIRAGHAWVGGLLCELGADTNAASQLDCPSSSVPSRPGRYLAYLEVWQREVQAVEDETLSDAALSGADTTVRLATVAQVRFTRLRQRARASEGSVSAPDTGTDATLRVTGRYGGLENRLYRIEVHAGGSVPTFKWSRDNASTTAAIESWTGSEIVLRHRVPSLTVSDWLEIVDRASVLERRPGLFVRIASINDSRIEVVNPPPEPVAEVMPMVRRWQTDPIPISAAGQSGLEDGLHVAFNGATFRSGDYWLFDARSADGSVTWPDATSAHGEQKPHGVAVQACPIALLHRDNLEWTVLEDLRGELRVGLARRR
jgi:hypothetical protein